MTFSVPEEVKKAFDQTFAGHNHSAAMTELLKDAMAQQALHQARQAAAQRLLGRLAHAPVTSAEDLARARCLVRA
ncbi:MAG: hypothetical protein C4K60_18585 [Ideonella sp. MAG2]|nr:MAG: hypothetical protein C4K60_18585 [Ideonella sp. MAG2]